jgi:predicted nucleotidyltransferase
MRPALAPAVQALARRVADRLAADPAVEAVALAGSRTGGHADPGSDLDLYVYAPQAPSMALRRAAAEGGRGLELGNHFFEPGDEWTDVATGLGVDVMLRTPAWIEDQLDRVLVRHEPSVGYSTAVWHGVRTSAPLFDRRGWFAALQARASAPYPEPLRRAVVARNQPLLRRTQSSYLRQLERAAARGDGVAVNHRAAAFLASAFDTLFAVNRATHPGEKRLLAHAAASCPRRPEGLDRLVGALLEAVPGPGVVAAADALGEAIDRLLAEEGLLP